ncbi:TrmH family RNA methyltransferase [Patescibacteria group bacterium]|nr:TrmH family RNA methyltransferase [Patescibacteria group bacterium]
MKKRKIIVVANKIRSAYNIGSIFRTADAIGAEKLFLAGYSPTPKNQPKVGKTALGAEKKVDWEHIFNLKPTIEEYKRAGYEIIALELNKRKSIDYRRWKPKNKVLIILGNEKTGILPGIQKQCDKIIHLPMLGQKNSLNVSVAFGAIGYYCLQ